MRDYDRHSEGLAKEMITIGRLLHQRGLVSGTDGNLSVRIRHDEVLITASGRHKGLLDRADLLVVNLAGQKLEGRGSPSTETPMHIAIYDAVKEAGAVIHAHAPWATAAGFGKERLDMRKLAEGRLLFPEVQVVPCHEPGSTALALAAGRAAQAGRIFVLEAHGVVAWGKDLLEAFCLVEQLENNLKIMALSSFFSSAR